MSTLDEVGADFAASQLAIDMAAKIDQQISISAGLQQKLDDANVQLASLNTQLADVQSKLSADDATIANLNSQIVTLNAQISDLSAQLAAKNTPPPPPPPTPGVYTRPDVVQGMTEVSPGVWKSTNFTASPIAVLQFHLPSPVPWGALIRKSFVRASNVPVNGSRNDKPDRDWLKQIGGTTADDFCGTQTDGSMVVQTEDATPISVHYDGQVAPDKPRGNATGPWNRGYFTWPGHNPNGQTEVWEKKYPSSPTGLDGYVRITINGVVVFYADKWQPGPDTRDILCLQEVVSGSALATQGAFVQFSNVKVEVVTA